MGVSIAHKHFLDTHFLPAVYRARLTRSVNSLVYLGLMTDMFSSAIEEFQLSLYKPSRRFFGACKAASDHGLKSYDEIMSATPEFSRNHLRLLATNLRPQHNHG